MSQIVIILVLLFAVAFLYSSVGHGGASGYLAVLSIVGISTAIIKPSALLLNIFVAGISFFHYYRQGHFRWKLFFPFALSSVPLAYLGSFVDLDPVWYKRILGICLIVATFRIVGVFNSRQRIEKKELNIYVGILIGATLGFLSGMIGIGGGIILSPVILIFNWGNLRETSAVSALFIVVNSIAGITGFFTREVTLPPQIFIWLAVAITGGFLGALWGSRKANNVALKRVLAGVLLLAAVKLIFI